MYNPENRKEDFEALCSQIKQELGPTHYSIILSLVCGITRPKIGKELSISYYKVNFLIKQIRTFMEQDYIEKINKKIRRNRGKNGPSKKK